MINMTYVSTVAQAEMLWAIADTATANAYDLAETLAANAWYLDTDRLEYERLASLWQVEKTRASTQATLDILYNTAMYYYWDYSPPQEKIDQLRIDTDTRAAADEAKLDIAWTKAQIAIDQTYTDAMLKAYNVAQESYAAAEAAYYERGEAALAVHQNASAQTAEQFKPAYKAVETAYEAAIASASADYFDAYFTANADASVSDSFDNSPWADGLRWLWETVAEAWEILREEFIDNLWTLQDNYTSPTDALFALLAEDENAFDDLTSPDVANTNPFVEHQAAKTQATAIYQHNSVAAKTEYDAVMIEILTELKGGTMETKSEYRSVTAVAVSTYVDSNAQVNAEANESFEILDVILSTSMSTTQKKKTTPLKPLPPFNIRIEPFHDHGTADEILEEFHREQAARREALDRDEWKAEAEETRRREQDVYEALEKEVEEQLEREIAEQEAINASATGGGSSELTLDWGEVAAGSRPQPVSYPKLFVSEESKLSGPVEVEIPFGTIVIEAYRSPLALNQVTTKISFKTDDETINLSKVRFIQVCRLTVPSEYYQKQNNKNDGQPFWELDGAMNSNHQTWNPYWKGNEINVQWITGKKKADGEVKNIKAWKATATEAYMIDSWGFQNKRPGRYNTEFVTAAVLLGDTDDEVQWLGYVHWNGNMELTDYYTWATGGGTSVSKIQIHSGGSINELISIADTNSQGITTTKRLTVKQHISNVLRIKNDLRSWGSSIYRFNDYRNEE